MHRFYGPADPEFGSWWKVPARKFWCYVRMLPVLEAREAVRLVNEMSFAFGGMSKEASRAFQFQLQSSASLGEDQPRVLRPSSPQQLAALSGGSTQVIMQAGPQVSSTLRAAEGG